MIKQIEVVPFCKTRGFDKFNVFVNQGFTPYHLFDIDKKIFDGWKGKDMINWFKCNNNDGINIEFYPDKYIVKFKTNTYTLPIPITIDNFLTDMDRLGIVLYWCEHIVKEQCPRNILNSNEIHKYYFDLLSRMNKSHEIIKI